MSALYAALAARLAAERERELLAAAARRRLAEAARGHAIAHSSLRGSIGHALITLGIWLAPEVRPLICSAASR